MTRGLLLLGAFLVLPAATPAQAPTQAPPQPAAGTPTIRSTAQEVVLDMVFRDKKGKTVRDIRPEEIHITEEGAEQKLNSLRLVEGTAPPAVVSGGAGAGEPAAAKPLDPMRQIRMVTLVFESLDQEGKRFLRQAVKDILDMAPEPNLYFSVFTIDQKLYCLQPFTQDHQALLHVLDKVGGWSFIQYATQSADVKQKLEQVVSTDMPTLSANGNSGPTQGQIGAMVSWMLAKIQYDTIQQSDAFDREASSRASLLALENLVREQAKLPGRKVILYFNPWLIIDERYKEMYEDLKSVANRSNVSFYTVDAKGLTTYSQNSGGRQMLANANAETRRSQLNHGAGEVTIGQVTAADQAVDAGRMNPTLWLKDLAQSTGGSAIVETNDYKAPLRTVMDEVRTYFEATYTPSITTYDGKYRKIAVKVDRPGIQVLSRNGYFALPVLSGGTQLVSFEMPLLTALNAQPAPSQLAFRAAAQRYNDRGPKVEYMLTVEAPMHDLVFAPHPESKTAAIDTSFLVLLKDEHGEVVDKFSKEFAVQVDAANVEGYKAGNLVQTFRAELKPGVYTMEAAVSDRNGDKASTKRVNINVPQPTSKLSLSDITVVRQAYPLKDNQILDAFYYEGGKIVPTLPDAMKGGPGNTLSFYFAVYPDKTVADAPKLTMTFFKDGQMLGSAGAPLPPPQKDGRIPYISTLPADKFVPGGYEILVGITQGQAKAEQKVAFKIE